MVLYPFTGCVPQRAFSSCKDPSLNSSGQVSPQETFDFIETSLKEALEALPVKKELEEIRISKDNGIKLVLPLS